MTPDDGETRGERERRYVLVPRDVLDAVLDGYADPDAEVTTTDLLTLRRSIELHDERVAEIERRGTVSDGYQEWVKCDRPNCGLEVVRIGKVQCWCDDGSEEPPNYDDEAS